MITTLTFSLRYFWQRISKYTKSQVEYQSLNGLAEMKKQNPALRVYINSETPDPALKVINGLKEIGFKVFTSHLIRVVNKKIKGKTSKIIEGEFSKAKYIVKKTLTSISLKNSNSVKRLIITIKLKIVQTT